VTHLAEFQRKQAGSERRKQAGPGEKRGKMQKTCREWQRNDPENEKNLKQAGRQCSSS